MMLLPNQIDLSTKLIGIKFEGKACYAGVIMCEIISICQIDNNWEFKKDYLKDYKPRWKSDFQSKEEALKKLEEEGYINKDNDIYIITDKTLQLLKMYRYVTLDDYNNLADKFETINPTDAIEARDFF